MKYKHIIWDWNGTLFDDADLCVEVMNECLVRRDLPQITRQDYMEKFCFPVYDYYLRLGFDFENTESFEKAGTEFIDEYEKRKTGCSLQAGALDALNWFRDQGVTQSVLTAYRWEKLEELLDHYDLRSYFTGWTGRDDHYAPGKTDLGIEWINKLPYEKEEALLIGDTEHDAEVAEAMGVDCLLVECGHATRERLSRFGVPVLDCLTDIFKVPMING